MSGLTMQFPGAIGVAKASWGGFDLGQGGVCV
jgi:hypothetical protein